MGSRAIGGLQALKRLGCDWIDASSGAQLPQQQVPLAPGFQVPFADRIRRETGVPTMAVGMITEPQQAEDIIAKGQADMVAIARGFVEPTLALACRRCIGWAG